jgi:hypothetical protein
LAAVCPRQTQRRIAACRAAGGAGAGLAAELRGALAEQPQGSAGHLCLRPGSLRSARNRHARGPGPCSPQRGRTGAGPDDARARGLRARDWLDVARPRDTRAHPSRCREPDRPARNRFDLRHRVLALALAGTTGPRAGRVPGTDGQGVQYPRAVSRRGPSRQRGALALSAGPVARHDADLLARAGRVGAGDARAHHGCEFVRCHTARRNLARRVGLPMGSCLRATTGCDTS